MPRFSLPLSSRPFQVFVGQRPFRLLEDKLRENDTEEQKRNREVEHFPPQGEDPFNPYRSTVYGDSPAQSPFLGGSNSNFGNLSSQALPLVSHAQEPRGHGDNESDYDHKTMQSDDEYSTPYTNNNDSASQVGTELYAPSRNMFGGEKTGHHPPHDKDIDAGEINVPTEGETAEALTVSPARKKWVALVWMLTFWLPSPLLRWIGGMKRPDVREAWREKLAINMIIWFICGCAVFVIAVLGNLICPRQYVYSSGELSGGSYANSPDAEYVAIRGEVFDVSDTALCR